MNYKQNMDLLKHRALTSDDASSLSTLRPIPVVVILEKVYGIINFTNNV